MGGERPVEATSEVLFEVEQLEFLEAPRGLMAIPVVAARQPSRRRKSESAHLAQSSA